MGVQSRGLRRLDVDAASIVWPGRPRGAPASVVAPALRRFSTVSPRLRDFLAALAGTAAIMGVILASGGIWEHVGGADLHGAYIPRFVYAAESISRLRLPLWNPYEFCGQPFLGLGLGALYPPVLVLFSAFDPRTAFQAFYALHVLLIAWPGIALLRAHGIDRQWGILATAIYVAGIFTGPGRGGIDHPQYLASIAWLPLMVLAWERAVRDRDRRWLAVFALAAGFQWLVGYPVFPMEAAVLVGVVALVSDAAPIPRRIGWLVAGCALGFMLGAVQLLPLSEAVRQSYRVEQAGGSFPAARALLAVHSFADLQRLVLDRSGLAALALVVAGLALGWRRRAYAAWLAALVWAVFALNPPLSALYLIPPYADVRYPLGWSHMAPCFFGWLAAAGAQALWDRRSWLWRGPAVALALLAALHAFTVIARAPTELPFHGPPTAITEERMRALERVRVDAGAPRALPTHEDLLLGASLRYRVPSPAGFEPSVPPHGPMTLLRVMGLDGWAADPGRPGVAQHEDLAALLGVGVLAVPPGSPPEAVGFVERATLPGNAVALARPAVPRVRLVHRVDAVATDADAVERTIADPADDVVIVAGDEPPSVAPPPGGDAESARIAVDEPEHVAIDVEARSDAMLMLTDTYYPGWSATVDGNPVPIWRANVTFRAVHVGPGAHRVEFRYAPRSFTFGAAVSALALVIVAVLTASATARAPRGAGS
jgi:hypothetical protein